MIYDRKNDTYYQESGSKFLQFLYNHLLGRMVLKIFTAPWITRLGEKYLSSSLSKHRISKFVRKNHISLKEYQKKEYTSFNDFFTRKIKRSARPLNHNKNLFIAPADARLTVYPIDEDSHFQIKNSDYTVEELLQDSELAKKYQGGYCFIYRLCVDDYHRYSYIDDGIVHNRKKIKGIFHTVQPLAFKKYKVFCENTREYQVLHTENFGHIIQMEVGALLVGKICNHKIDSFHRGEEKGYFSFGGSTIIVLTEKGRVCPDKDILQNSSKEIETRVYLYESVGKKKYEI